MNSVCVLLQNHYEFDVRVRRKVEVLVAAGYDVDVFALRNPGSSKTYFLDGATLHTISLGKRRGSLVRYALEYLAFFLWSMVRVTSLMRRKRYVLIDVNTLPDFLVFATIFAKWMGAKIILDMHEITPEFYMSKYGIMEDSWSVRLLKYVERISFDFADHVLTINEPIQSLLVRRGLSERKSTIIMNSVDESRFASHPRSLEASNAIGGPGKFVMMYHGTLTKLYGLDVAIDAFSIVQTEMPEAELWILGNGPEAGPLENLVRDRGLASKIKLVGRIPQPEIPAWLNQCDIGILPIRRDVFLEFASPNKLPEYIVMGKSVIISRLKAIRHCFSENALAYFEPQDAADLAKQMIRLYRDSGLRARMAARAIEEYAPIRWEIMKKRYLKMIDDMVGPRRTMESSRLTPVRREGID